MDLSGVSEAERDQHCLDSALRFLAPRPRSEREVRRRLAEKGYEPDRVDRAIAKLRDLRYLDDRAFAEYWIENRTLHRPKGGRALRAELFQKGIEREVVDLALDAPAGGERDETEDAYRAAQKKAASLSQLDETTFRQRLSQFLLRRGFDWDTVLPTVERLWGERG